MAAAASSVPTPQLRLAEVLAALSLTTDLGAGMPFEKGLRTCVVASALAASIHVSGEQRRAVFHAALLRSIGCTAHAPENAAMFGDDLQFEKAFKELDPADHEQFSARFGDWHPPRQQQLLALVVAHTPTTGAYAVRSGCEVSAALGVRLGIGSGAIAALNDVYERWDGRGLPVGRAGDQIDPIMRIVHVAEQAVLGHFAGGISGAREEVRRRAGGQLDPGVCEEFLKHTEAALHAVDAPDVLAAVAAAEPRPTTVVQQSELDGLCLAFAIFADLKGTHLIGHSPHVAELAGAAARLMGMHDPQLADIHTAGLLHDLGRTAVSSEIWERAGPLGPADRERVRLHTYWTERILTRCPAIAAVSRDAAAHHERLDASGYHRGASASELGPSARVLAAADVFAAMTESRPHRPPLTADEAARGLLSEVSAGKLDPAAAAAVIQAAGLPRPRASWPCGLTDREVDVLRLCARGLSNRSIADKLVVSARTVQHHLASIYDKTDRRTRATTVSDIYAAFGRGDIPAVLDRIAPGCRWEMWADNYAQAAGLATMQARVGPAGVADFFVAVSQLEFHEFRVLDLVASEHQVVAEVQIEYTTPAGKRLRDEELHLWTLDGAQQVERMRHYVDTAKHIAAFAQSEQPEVIDLNKALARRFVLEHNQADYAATFDDLLAPHCTLHEYLPGMPAAMDRQAYEQFIAMFRSALPDIRNCIEDLAAEGDRVCVRWTGRGTHTGTPLLGIAAKGNQLTAHGMYVLRMESGKVVEVWGNWDNLNVLQQLGEPAVISD